MTKGLYIHIPFCAKKCPYCDFYSIPYKKDTINRYADAVMNAMRKKYFGETIDTVYFGGGTPTLMPTECMQKIMDCIKDTFKLSSDAEITIEANPHTVSPQKLLDLNKMGINRISFGIQSCVDNELHALGRTHTFAQAKNTVLDAKAAGFDNISCDLMLGIKGQTASSLEYSINQLAKLPITHISAYILKIEENTPFNCNEIINSLPNEDTVSDFYLNTTDMLAKLGFKQYEISNFAKPHFESKHNLKYWRCEQYIGIGCSAHSFYNGKRFYEEADMEKYLKYNGMTADIVTDEHPASFEETAMLRLRLSEGLDMSNFKELSQSVIKKAYPLQKMGFVNINGEVISLTPKGFLVSNSIIERLIF